MELIPMGRVITWALKYLTIIFMSLPNTYRLINGLLLLSYGIAGGGVVISGNYLTGAVDFGGESTDDTGLYGFACQITDNTIEMSALQPYDHTGVYLESDVSGGAEITRNYIKNFNNGVLLNTLSGPLDHQEDILIAYNIIVETLKTTGNYSGRAIGHGVATSGSTYDNVKILNNIIYNVSYIASAGVHFASPGVTYTDIQIRNNIFVKAYNAIRFENNTVEGLDITNNLFYLHTNDTSYVSAAVSDSTTTNNIMSDPLFVSTSDFHLQAGSPCINAGINVGLTTDYAGRTVASPPEIGAYEY